MEFFKKYSFFNLRYRKYQMVHHLKIIFGITKYTFLQEHCNSGRTLYEESYQPK